jgi:hypothetical protein
MTSRTLASSAGPLTLPRWLPLAGIVLVAIVLRHIVVPNSDVSWDLTLADKVLDGQRLYVDLIEVNPPATVYLYMVPAILGRWSGLPAELFVDALVFLAAGLSLWLSCRILSRAGILLSGGWELAVAAAVLLILPAHTFGEREHIVLIAFLPLLALAAARATGDRPELWMVIVAGLCGGFVAIIKPFFVAPIVCMAAIAAYSVRSWRSIFALENWIAAGLLAAYSAAVLIAFPEFIRDVTPLVLDIYVPAKLSLWNIVSEGATVLLIGAWLVIGLFKRRSIIAPPFCLLPAATFGFAIAFYVQAKGWPYQSYPMLALTMIAFMLVFFEHWRPESSPASGERQKRMALALAAGLILGGSFAWFNLSLDLSALAQTVHAIKPRPKILALSIDLSVGFPLTRAVDGSWVGRVPSLWVSGNVWSRGLKETLGPHTLAKLKAYADRDRAMLAEDIARGQPDVILVDHRQKVDWPAWIAAYAPLAEQMTAYRKVGTVGEFDVLSRDPGG